MLCILCDIIAPPVWMQCNYKFKTLYSLKFLLNREANKNQGFNARKVISDVYASFVLQFTVSGR